MNGVPRTREMVSWASHGDVAVITVDNPPVNALSPGVPEGIQAALWAAGAAAEIRGVVLIGAGPTFIAGADIRELGRITSGRKEPGEGLVPLLRALEESPKPVVCAIHGTALGGGLEVAMACHYRVAVSSAQVGQPEVKLGLIPGAGGTQRLPRLAGVAKALEMCAQGQPLGAPEAREHGILDALVDGDLLQGALVFLRARLAAGGPHPRTRDLEEKLGGKEENAALLAAAREATKKAGPALLAPLKAIDAIEAATRLPFDEGLAREAALFRDCLYSDQSKALIHVFFAERAAARIPGLPKDGPVVDVRRAAVVGSGTMGSGIAMAYANAGIPVVLMDTDQSALDRALAGIEKTYAGAVKRGRLTPEKADERRARIRAVRDWDGFAEADVVVEAVFETMEVKKEVFAQLDRVCRKEAILATNTSYLDIDEIASATSRPERVIGNHFFAPANVMRLLEVVRGKASGADVIASSMALARRLGKVGVLAGNCRGFIGNRMYALYQRESQRMVEEGAAIAAVDAALRGFGMAMGPLETGDLSGLDVGWRIRKAFRHLEPPGTRPLLADHLCELGRFGQKTGAGWYRYEPGARTPRPDPAMEEIVASWVRQAGTRRRDVPAEEIVDRTILALVNEGARILEDGIALRAGDIDVVYVDGYGFPSHRGGPMWHADAVGLPRVLERVRQFHDEHGERWRPAPLLERLAAEGRTFRGLDAEKG